MILKIDLRSKLNKAKIDDTKIQHTRMCCETALREPMLKNLIKQAIEYTISFIKYLTFS